ncbi:hypothetical protein NPIL_95731 [Nephila pilipes]|uniref:Uncharacterized protein n=1 Tax=Nephila pilipes TaxID=299642 RepID=A0A8X6UAS6_NEPPI|nr:hypothetical protein NPIL_95731 [Nephila pilipes]
MLFLLSCSVLELGSKRTSKLHVPKWCDGTSQNIHDQFFDPFSNLIPESTVLEHMGRTIEEFTTVPTSNHSSRECFVHSPLIKCAHVFARKDLSIKTFFYLHSMTEFTKLCQNKVKPLPC